MALHCLRHNPSKQHQLPRALSCLRKTRGASRSLWVDASKDSVQALANKEWDAIVIGGGHNGLTAAAYLAKAGRQVAVLERRHVIGGAAVTEEIVPGFKFSRASYLQSLLRPSIIKELELHRHGLRLLRRNPASFTPTVDGRYLLMGPDPKLNFSEISKFSPKDARMYPEYEAFLEKCAGMLEPLLDSATPEAFPVTWQARRTKWERLREGAAQARTAKDVFDRAVRMGRKDLIGFVELLMAPAAKVLDRWFESDVLKATLATDAVIGAMMSPKSLGSGYVLLHHVMGETNGEPGVWSYVEGGMGAVSTAIGRAATEAGATIAVNAEVAEVLVEGADDAGRGGRVSGVLLGDGTHVRAKQVLSNATANVTFTRLVPSKYLSDDFTAAVKAIDYSSGTTKINVAVDRLPNFSAFPSAGPEPGPQHRGTVHLGADSMGEIHQAYVDAVGGHPSQRPLIELTIPSALDNTIAPSGKHVINMFVQYTPYHLKNGTWADPGAQDAFADKCFALLEEYAPGFTASVIDRDVLTPPDIERVFGLTGGSIFQGAMGLDALFLFRPVRGWSGYRAPVGGLYMCGASCHPGGGVMGAPGRNAAAVALSDSSTS